MYEQHLCSFSPPFSLSVETSFYTGDMTTTKSLIVYFVCVCPLAMLSIVCNGKITTKQYTHIAHFIRVFSKQNWFLFTHFASFFFPLPQPVGIYPKKYDWAGTTAFGMGGMPSQHIGGDCSLWVRAATIDFDDGEWECQVTASDFAAQDALTSQPIQLVVRGKCFLLIILLAIFQRDFRSSYKIVEPCHASSNTSDF